MTQFWNDTPFSNCQLDIQAEKDLVKERAKLNRFEFEEKDKIKSKINSTNGNIQPSKEAIYQNSWK